MISANNITLRLGKKALFEDVNVKFTEGNCYGLIGANGAGKSTFLKILSGQLEPTSGDIVITPGQRLSFLQQDHFKYDEYTVLDTVIMGNKRLYDIMKEKDAIYMKEDFSDEDGIRASELEAEFADMDGWNAESDAATLLNGLGIPTEDHYTQMADLPGAAKVKVLLAQALFGNPDILLLDEPTNHLDLDAIAWLEEFLINFENTVIVVSHDRYFLNKVCTNIADMDYGKIQLYAGNYDFWYESSQLLVRQMKEANKKKEEKIKELQEFISRFSANASKSKQATSRKRALEKIQLDEIRPSSRKYPYIDFRPSREIGNEVLTVEGITKTIDGVKVLDNVSFIVGHEDKIAFVGGNELAKTTLFKIISGEMEPDSGSYKWGVTTSQSYFPKDNTAIFDTDLLIVDWLTQYSEIKDATYVRGFLGRMLFPGEDGVKRVRVLSGGEKVRCLLSKMMISGANILILDEPTAVLTPQETEKLFRVLRKMRDDGKAIVIITHKMHEVESLSDRVAVLRSGQYIGCMKTKDTNVTEMTNMMVGHAVTLNIARPDPVDPKPRIEVKNLTVRSIDGIVKLDDVSFTANSGEILGIAGISGCGQKELLEAIAGLQPTENGSICYVEDDGTREELLGKDPLSIAEMGVALSFVPEDRLGMGLVGNMDLSDNMMLRSFRKGRGILTDRKSPRKLAETVVEELDVNTPGVTTPVRRLSGGNVQKVLVGREIASAPTVLLTAYAVRGLDINASYTIYDLINRQKERGVAVIYVGEDLDVLLELADRILVLCGGKVSGIVPGRGATKRDVGMMMTQLGGNEAHA